MEYYQEALMENQEPLRNTKSLLRTIGKLLWNTRKLYGMARRLYGIATSCMKCQLKKLTTKTLSGVLKSNGEYL